LAGRGGGANMLGAKGLDKPTVKEFMRTAQKNSSKRGKKDGGGKKPKNKCLNLGGQRTNERLFQKNEKSFFRQKKMGERGEGCEPGVFQETGKRKKRKDGEGGK